MKVCLLACLLLHWQRLTRLSLVRTEQLQLYALYFERRDFLALIATSQSSVRSFLAPTLRQTCSRYNQERHLRSKIR